MPTVQVLKKKLKGVRTTRKISKAMKTAATVKYSRLSTVYSGYSRYAEQCKTLYNCYAEQFRNVLPPKKNGAPVCYIVMASNKGMCGNFNSELFNFAQDILERESESFDLILCGEKTVSQFRSKGYGSVKEYIFNDVPQFSEAKMLYEEIFSLLYQKGYGSVKIIYPAYVNMMKQQPCIRELFSTEQAEYSDIDDRLFIPDKATVINNSVEKIITSTLYGVILETAIGAQAATVMNMRSAYDTATEFEEKLESEINRKRQSQVTADVIETSAEISQEEE